MKTVVAWTGTIRKSIATALTGTLAWATVVVHSESVKITGDEWLGLAGVWLTVVIVYLVGNDPPLNPPAPAPAPEFPPAAFDA